jgi:hypothetical protein
MFFLDSLELTVAFDFFAYRFNFFTDKTSMALFLDIITNRFRN